MIAYKREKNGKAFNWSVRQRRSEKQLCIENGIMSLKGKLIPI